MSVQIENNGKGVWGQIARQARIILEHAESGTYRLEEAEIISHSLDALTLFPIEFPPGA